MPWSGSGGTDDPGLRRPPWRRQTGALPPHSTSWTDHGISRCDARQRNAGVQRWRARHRWRVLLLRHASRPISSSSPESPWSFVCLTKEASRLVDFRRLLSLRLNTRRPRARKDKFDTHYGPRPGARIVGNAVLPSGRTTHPRNRLGYAARLLPTIAEVGRWPLRGISTCVRPRLGFCRPYRSHFDADMLCRFVGACQEVSAADDRRTLGGRHHPEDCADREPPAYRRTGHAQQCPRLRRMVSPTGCWVLTTRKGADLCCARAA